MDSDQKEQLEADKTHSHAIKLLEGALQKMNGIILSEPISNCTKLCNNSNVHTELNNLNQQKNNNDITVENDLETYKLKIALLNNQVDTFEKKLNLLEIYLSQQIELRQKSENRLQKELILKSKLETEKQEVIAILTNLKLVNIKLTNENMELKKMLINNQNTQNSEITSYTTNSQFRRSKNQGSRFYCSLPRQAISKKKNEPKNPDAEALNDITESCVNLCNRISQFDKCSSAPNLVDPKTDFQNEQISENNSSLSSNTKMYLYQNSDLPFSERNRQQLYDWFAEQGIGYVLLESKCWPTSGKELITSSINKINEKLKFKHWLHRKKLILAIQCETGQNILIDEEKYLSKARYLNTTWVLQWLDDIGLPQYKDPFSKAAINGIILHRLTKDDFLMMQNGNSDLHFSSLRCGIKVLRDNNFDPEYLIRRSNTNKNEGDCDLSLWTTHRVMEWLCCVNLAEYASNLRGSGVHGGLIVYDDRFTSDLLADILFIHQNKTLLRRHLSIQFSELLGKDLNQKKRDAQFQSKYKPLTISSKIKVQKKSQFLLSRKKNNELAVGELICPIDE